jgi:hypothetical protein
VHGVSLAVVAEAKFHCEAEEASEQMDSLLEGHAR